MIISHVIVIDNQLVIIEDLVIILRIWSDKSEQTV